MASESIAIDSAEQSRSRGIIVKYTYNMPCDLSLILVYNLDGKCKRYKFDRKWYRSKRVLKLHRTYNVLQGMIRKLLCCNWSRQLRQYRWKDIFFVHELSLSCFRSHDQFFSQIVTCEPYRGDETVVTSPPLNLTSLVKWQTYPSLFQEFR